MAACQRLMPSSIFSIYESIITMELSTIIPKATISEARVTVFSSKPRA